MKHKIIFNIRMTLTNFDASQLSLKRRNKALYSWRLTNDSARNNGGATVLKEQPVSQSGYVVNDRKLGASACGCNTADDASKTYQFNGLSQGNQVNF